MVLDNDLALYHHGIEGQKWGQQNGPPYPLDPNKDYSKKELRALRKQARKEERKENRRRKKLIKRYEKEEAKRKEEEEEEKRIEEAKKKAIASGSLSEIEKYKDKMSNDELTNALTRAKILQSLEDTKIKELDMDNQKTQKEIDRISKANDLRNKKLDEKYGKTKNEARLEKIARNTKLVGNMAMDINKILIAVKTGKSIDWATDKKTKPIEDEAISKAKEDGKKLFDKAVKTVKNDYSKAKEKVEKESSKKSKPLKGEKVSVEQEDIRDFVDAVFNSNVKNERVDSFMPSIINASKSTNSTMKYLPLDVNFDDIIDV